MATSTDGNFASWIRLLQEKAADQFLTELGDWQQILQAPAPSFTAERCEKQFDSRYAIVRRRIGEGRLTEIEPVLKTLRLSMHELLLAAFALSVADQTQQREFRIFVEGHGREPLDPKQDYSRTIGWFTSLYPIRFNMPKKGDGNLVLQLKEQMRIVPTAGLGFGVLKFLASDSNVRGSLPMSDVEVIFNYLGKRQADDQLDVTVSRPLKLHRSPGIRRKSVLEFNVLLNGGMDVEIEFNCEYLSENLVARLLNDFDKNLEFIVKSAANEASVSLSDFPLANLDVEGLSDLAAALKKSNKKG